MRINPAGAKDGELVFVSGHPGTTKRDLSYSQVLFNRDVLYPARLESIDKTLKTLYEYSKRGTEEKRRAATLIFYLENSQKALGSEYIGLKNSEFTSALEQKERVLKDKIAQDPELVKSVGSAFKDKEKAMKLYAKNYDKLVYRYIAGNTLPKLALSMAFYATETLKPDKDRFKGYHDSQLEEWKYINFSPAPIYNDLEEVMLQSDLELALEKLGADDEAVKEVLEGKTPAERAKELISGTKLQSVEVRKQLIEGGIEAMKKSDDPLIKMALKLAPILHKEIKWQEKEIEPMVIPASEKIADAKFKIYGKTIYPDATFTLRMSYGTVKGYEMNGTMAPPFTTFYGLYDRYHGFEGEGDWAITEKVLNARNKVDYKFCFRQ